MLRRLLGRKRESIASSSTTALDNGDDFESRPVAESVASSHSKQKRSSHFKARRKETQDILGNPDQFLERLLENGLFGPDFAPVLDLNRTKSPLKIYKEGKLEKQGNLFKTWHKRYFVLTSRGLSYYESKKKFRSGFLPFGVILFKDVISENSQVVHDVPDHLVPVLQLTGKRNLFCVHIENRTYVISASSTDDKEEWAKAITKAYHKATDKTLAAVKRVRKTRKVTRFDDMFSEIHSENDLYAQFTVVLNKYQSELVLKRTLQAWKVYSRFCKNNPQYSTKGKPPRRKTMRQHSVVNRY